MPGASAASCVSPHAPMAPIMALCVLRSDDSEHATSLCSPVSVKKVRTIATPTSA